MKATPHRSEAGSVLTPAAPPRLPMPGPAEPAPQPVVRDDVVLTPAQPKQAVAYEAPAAQQPAYEEEPLDHGVLHSAAGGARRSPGPHAAGRRAADARPRTRSAPAAASPMPAQEQKPSLLQRLATVGFGRKDEPHHAPRRAGGRPGTRRIRSRPPSSVHAEYAKQRAPAPQGYRPRAGPRMAPAQRNMEDDQLEIPAFLRRQAN